MFSKELDVATDQVTRHTSQHNDLPLRQGQTRSVFSPASTRQIAASCSGRSRSMPRISRATRRASRRFSSVAYVRSLPADATRSRSDAASRPVVMPDSTRLIVRRAGAVAENAGTVFAGPRRATPRRHAALAARLTRATRMPWLQRIIVRGRPAGGGLLGIVGGRNSARQHQRRRRSSLVLRVM